MDLPCAATTGAWRGLLGAVGTRPDGTTGTLGDDRGVLLEPYNEPLSSVAVQPASQLDEDGAQWEAAFRPVVHAIRAAGARNVLIADVIRSGQFAPVRHTLDDPQLAYGIHPYPMAAASAPFHTPSDWDDAFGHFCDSGHACVATEWATPTPTQCYDDADHPTLDSPALTATIQQYLHAHHLGSVMSPGDMEGAIVRRFSPTAEYPTEPTEWGNHFSCTADGGPFGPGHEAKRFFSRHVMPTWP